MLILTLLSFIPSFQKSIAEDEVDPQLKARAREIIQHYLDRLASRLETESKMGGLRAKKAETRSTWLGFESIEQLRNAKPDTSMPFRVFLVGLDQLRAHQPRTDPWPLLKPTNALIFPVVAPPSQEGKEIVLLSAIMDVDADGNNKEIHIAQFGGNSLVPIRALMEGREKLLQDLKKNCDCFLIWIPALSQPLLGVGPRESFQVLVLNQGPKGLDKGGLRSAKDVFAELAENARTGGYDMPEEPTTRRRRN